MYINPIVIMAMSLGISIVNHGRPRSNDNFFASLVAIAITLTLLILGGFFSH